MTPEAPTTSYRLSLSCPALCPPALCGALIVLLLCAVALGAQAPLAHRYESTLVDSGDVFNRAAETKTVFETTVQFPDAPWLRLYFTDTVLGRVPGKDSGTVLRLTSLADGAVQEHTSLTLAQWRGSSAFFNGDSVLVELVAEPDAASSRVRIHEVMVGELVVDLPEAPDRSICGAVDDRTLLNDPRAGRVSPVGCTAWLINDAEGCFLTAGHCIGDSFDIVEFNVPLSEANGAVNHPAPQDQYPVDPSSIQFDQTVIGNDWAYFGAFPNGFTELSPAEAQGSVYTLGAPPITATGETIRITGYGSIDGTQGTPQTWSQVSTTHTGPLTAVIGTRLEYQVDTTGGDSGSAVLDEAANEAIGIHTNAGCSVAGGANSATSLANAGIINALAAPLGVCSSGPQPLHILVATPVPDLVPAGGTSFEVDILDRNDLPATLNSATLHYETPARGPGGSTPLVSLGAGHYRADLPAGTCGTELSFRIEAEDSMGVFVRHPFSAENSVERSYVRQYGESFDGTFQDNFEADQGWVVEDLGGLSAGAWERGFPAGYGLRADPPWDGDTTGHAYFTDPRGGNTDVDGGTTRLLSPMLDASSPEAHFRYLRWWSDENSATADDTFLVEVSDDDGANWTQVEQIGPNVVGSWVEVVGRVADFVTPNAQFRIRFTASDLGTGSIVEAGIDGVSLRNSATGVDCSALFADGFESGDTAGWSSTSP